MIIYALCLLIKIIHRYTQIYTDLFARNSKNLPLGSGDNCVSCKTASDIIEVGEWCFDGEKEGKRGKRAAWNLEHVWLVGGFLRKKMSQLGWWNSRLNGKIKVMFRSPPTVHQADEHAQQTYASCERSCKILWNFAKSGWNLELLHETDFSDVAIRI